MKSEPGPPMTLGNAAAARVRLIVWSRIAAIKSSPIRPRWLLGAAPKPVLDLPERLVCSKCDSRQADMVVRVKCARGPLPPPRILADRPLLISRSCANRGGT
jgi:hypothetical protein